jgi:type I restriction enzyme, S subunit
VSFPRYPKYKDSGVEWLTTVPAHWGEVRGDAVIREKYESNKGMLSDNLLSLSFGRIVRKDVFSNDGLLPESFETYQVVDPGDIVFRPTDLQNDWNSLRSAIVEERGIITSAYIAVTSSVAVPRYLHYLFRAYDHTKVFYSMGGGLRQAFKFADLRRLPLLMPPLPEQTTIATFLDRETAKIDALIAEQQRLIELLQEKRQAVISHAVTKGLNPDAPMKDSGIEWLGEVPEHWAVPPVFVRYEAVLGKMVDEKKATGVHPVPYLRNADVYWDQINTTDLPTLDIQPHERTRFTVRRGDVLICEGGAGIGQTAIWQGGDDTTAFQKALHRLRPWDTSKEDPRYFFYCMRFVVESGILLAGGTATIPHLTGEQLRRYRFPCPPLPEQRAIIEHLDAVGREMDALHEAAAGAITLLQERRSALISAAVTGQIDVRGLASLEAA